MGMRVVAVSRLRRFWEGPGRADSEQALREGDSARASGILQIPTRCLVRIVELDEPDLTSSSVGPVPSLPGNRLKSLSGKRAGQHSIRINERWRICFMWRARDAYNVEIVDYH